VAGAGVVAAVAAKKLRGGGGQAQARERLRATICT
jgi:hypothetical protein